MINFLLVMKVNSVLYIRKILLIMTILIQTDYLLGKCIEGEGNGIFSLDCTYYPEIKKINFWKFLTDGEVSTKPTKLKFNKQERK